MAAEKIGRITQVIGAVLDIRFQAGELPLINEASSSRYSSTLETIR